MGFRLLGQGLLAVKIWIDYHARKRRSRGQRAGMEIVRNYPEICRFAAFFKALILNDIIVLTRPLLHVAQLQQARTKMYLAASRSLTLNPPCD